MDEITIMIISAIISFFVSLIVSLITVYILHTPLGCQLGVHKYEKEGSALKEPIEYHMVCLRCGKTKTVYRKPKKKTSGRIFF